MKLTKNVCIYHSIDLDGWISAAIVKHWFEQEKERLNGREEVTMDFIGYNYGQPIPDLSEYNRVIMCDISFPVEEMDNLNFRLRNNFIWIDHHISAIDFNFKDHNGLRNIKFAACELTWLYFMTNVNKLHFDDRDIETMPEIVRLLGLYDSFRHKNTNEETKVLEFQYGARQVISDYENAYHELLIAIDEQNKTRDEVLTTYRFEDIHVMGMSIYKYLCTEAKQSYKNGFEITLQEPFVGEWGSGKDNRKFICINKERFNPISFRIDYHADGYDGAMCWHLGADKTVNISFYNDNGQVDCSAIAKEFGGGGHRGAAGCRMSINDFNKLISNE